MKRLVMMAVLISVLLATGGCATSVPATSPSATLPADFNFIFKYGVGARNILDTFQGTFTRDMVLDPAVTIEMHLTTDEMIAIYQKMRQIDFFNYPDQFTVTPPAGETVAEVTPFSTYFFRVVQEGKTQELLWQDKIMNPDEMASKLRELIKLIRSIIESKEEYKKLPTPRGGYL